MRYIVRQLQPKASLPRSITAAIAVALAAALLLQFVQLCRGPRGDFPNHWEFGRRMAASESIYASGLNVVYPPLWSLVHAPLTVLSPHAAQIVLFPLFVVALGSLVWTLRKLTNQHFAADGDNARFAMAVAVLLAGRLLFRDMVECGANLALVALAWLAIYFWTRRREWLGGMCLGLAISLKCTPVAFLAYFLWKRQWKMAAAATTAATVFSLSPAVWMGPTRYAEAISIWSAYARRGLTEQDPTTGVLGPDTVQNLSLRPALAAAFAPALGAGKDGIAPQPLRADHAAVSSGLIIKALLLAIALAVAWRFRRRGDDRTAPAVLWECAIISLAMLLYSPITWTQHCVGVLPAMFLLLLSAQAPGRVPRWSWAVIAGYVLAVLVLNRALLGREWSLVLLSYRVHAWSLVGLFFVAIACHQRAVASTREDALANLGDPCTLRRQIPLGT